jgi:Uma2 family endonuclease
MERSKIKEDSATEDYFVESPDISHIETEDDTPVDNIFSEKQQRLLAESLNGSWNPGRPFVAFANVGIFYGINIPPVVPDMFLSLDAKVAEDVWKKENRSYFVWEFGKPPEVVVEVVSNKKGGEADAKMEIYARIGVWYYVIFDPLRFVQKDELRIYELSVGQYIPKMDRWLGKAGLGVTVWDGLYEGTQARWLRWCDKDGNLVPTGSESARLERENAERERESAERERENAERERKRAEAAERQVETAAYERAAETARKMLEDGLDMSVVSKYTGLSAEDIRRIRS